MMYWCILFEVKCTLVTKCLNYKVYHIPSRWPCKTWTSTVCGPGEGVKTAATSTPSRRHSRRTSLRVSLGRSIVISACSFNVEKLLETDMRIYVTIQKNVVRIIQVFSWKEWGAEARIIHRFQFNIRITIEEVEIEVHNI